MPLERLVQLADLLTEIEPVERLLQFVLEPQELVLFQVMPV